jgi:hypothetical protein
MRPCVKYMIPQIFTQVAVTAAAVTMLLFVPAALVAQCCGDCNGDGQVTIDELLKAVNRALGGTCTSQSGGQRFPATGQTTCWDTIGNVIACGGTGQDGQIQAGGALAYVDNGDGTITDLNTHLMWEKKSTDGSIHNWGNAYTWADAFSTFIGGLNAGAGFAGHTDWRLPNVKELQSIIDYQNYDPAVSPALTANCTGIGPGCTVTTCSCTNSADYWSSTTYWHYPEYAWGVWFLNGTVHNDGKGSINGVRAVRGGS